MIFKKMRQGTLLAALVMSVSAFAGAPMVAAQTDQAQAQQPWLNKRLSADKRADLAVAAMTRDEKLSLVFGFASGDQMVQVPDAVVPADIRKKALATTVPGSAGWIPGIARLGIPEQFQTDASHGVRNPKMDGHTSLPSSLATAASFDPKLTYEGGVMIGKEARLSGFNIMLAGGFNLNREPRNGRNFEYGGEDPLLAATVSAGLINGIQSNNIVSTMKHYALNAQETGRFVVNAQISDKAARESDYLAFELVNEWSKPGSVMCAYNLINDIYACQNEHILTQILKKEWKFKGYVMSDWGAVHTTVLAANAGLDQQSGFPFDKKPFFGHMLKDALDDGSVSEKRLDDMARRIVWALFDKGVVDNPLIKGPIDWEANAKVTLKAAQQSMVLLKNKGGLLPLKAPKSIAMIGGYADKGVLAGGGSSLVMPRGGNAVPGLEPKYWPGPVVYHPSSPVKYLKEARPKAKISYLDGKSIDEAVKLAKKSDVAIVFVTQWAGEAFDVSLDLDGNQYELVAAVAKANPRTIVVVESGGAIYMPWLKDVSAVLQAWYPGTEGGRAIADVLTGVVNPSAKLPISFPASDDQFVRQKLDGVGLKDKEPFTVRYTEGAAIGYKWHDKNGHTPLFSFGYGLSYTSFKMDDLSATETGGVVTLKAKITNSGKVYGGTVPQFYASPIDGGWEAPKRLVAFDKVWLKPGESAVVTLKVEPRLLASWDVEANRWKIAGGDYRFMLASSSNDVLKTVTLKLAPKAL